MREAGPGAPGKERVMGKVFESIDDKMRAWVGRQPMFFVATAPLSGDGMVNLTDLLMLLAAWGGC